MSCPAGRLAATSQRYRGGRHRQGNGPPDRDLPVRLRHVCRSTLPDHPAPGQGFTRSQQADPARTESRDVNGSTVIGSRYTHRPGRHPEDRVISFVIFSAPRQDVRPRPPPTPTGSKPDSGEGSPPPDAGPPEERREKELPIKIFPRTRNPRPSTPEHSPPTRWSTASASPVSPVPSPAWPDCPIRGICQEGDRAFLPGVVLYRPGMSAAFEPGGGNGRALDDDSVDIAVGFLAGSPLGGAVVPRPPSPAFPYLPTPQPADLPALADLFGRCGQHSEQTPSPAGRRS